MSRRVTFVTLALTAVVAFLVGAIVAGGFARPSVVAQVPPARRAVQAVAAADTNATRSPQPPLRIEAAPNASYDAFANVLADAKVAHIEHIAVIDQRAR